MNRHDHHHNHNQNHHLPSPSESGGMGDDMTMGRGGLPHRGGPYDRNNGYENNNSFNNKSNTYPSSYGHDYPPPHPPSSVVESRHPPSTSSRVQEQHFDQYSRHPPPPSTLHQPTQQQHVSKDTLQLVPPPHPADKFGKTITVSSRTTIHDENDDESNNAVDAEIPPAMEAQCFKPSNGGSSAFKPYYRPPVLAPLPQPQVGVVSNLLDDDEAIMNHEKTSMMEEQDRDDTSDDRASDDEIKAANMGIIQAREEDEYDDYDDENEEEDRINDVDDDAGKTPYIVVESRQDNDLSCNERKKHVQMARGDAGQGGGGVVPSNDHPVRVEPRENVKTASSIPFVSGFSQRKKLYPIAISTTATTTTTLKRPRDEHDGNHYDEYAFGDGGLGGGGGVDDETPKHINFRRNPPSFFPHTKQSSSEHHYHHPSGNQHQPDIDRRDIRWPGYTVKQSNPPPAQARQHTSQESSMDDYKEDRQDRSTYATTSGGGWRQSYDDGYYHRELHHGSNGQQTQHASRVHFQDKGVEREDGSSGEGGIQTSWLVPNDDRNDSNALKTASSNEYGGDGSIIGSSSYLNFSRSLSWEIPAGTLSGIGKSTSFSTAQPQQQNDQQQQESDADEATIAADTGEGANVRQDSDAKPVDFPPLQSIGSGSLPPRKRPILLAPRSNLVEDNTATKSPRYESYDPQYPAADTTTTTATKINVEAGNRERSYEPPTTVHHPRRQEQHPPSLPSRQQNYPQNHQPSHQSQVRSYDHNYHQPYQLPPPPPPPPHHHHHHSHLSQHHPQQRYYDSRFEPPRGRFYESEGYGMGQPRSGPNERVGQHSKESSARFNPLPAIEYSAKNGPSATWKKPAHSSGSYPHHDGGLRLLHSSARDGNTGVDLDGEDYASDSRSFDSSSLSRKSFRSLDDLEEPMQNLLYRPSFSWERGLDVPCSSGNGIGGDGSDCPPLPALKAGGGRKKGGTSSTSAMIQLSGQQKIMKALAMRSEIRTIGNPNGPMGVILLLAMPQDRHCLSETLCIVRNNIEVFTATEVDINAPAPGRKRPIQVGQVGLRCVYCRMCAQRDRVKRATCFPSSMKRIYRAVIDMKLDHFKNCPYVPSGLKGRLDQLQAGSTRSTGMTVQYFVKSAKELGMMDNVDDGVCIDLKRVGTVRIEEHADKVSPPLPPPPLPPPPLPPMSMGEDVVAPYKAASDHPPSNGKQKKAKRQQQKQKQQQHETNHHHKVVAMSAVSYNAPYRDENANSFEHQFPEIRYSGKVLLALPDDENFLSPLRCFLRMNVCAFTASAHDIAVRTPTTFAVHVGQVGVGCVHCLAVPPKARSNRAVCFPFAMSRIYQSVADIQRFHLGECRMMPPNVRAEFLKLQSESAKGSRGLATRTYWTDSAKKIGLADGPTGMYFCRDPSLPPQSEGNARVEQMDSESRDNSCNELVAPEDKPTIADFLYLVMEQLRPCRFTDADRNKRRSKNVGCIGVECKHCAGKIDGRKFFWSSVSAAESNFVSVHSHMLSCKYIPESLKAELTRLKALRREQTSRLKNGSQKAFFMRVWARLHGMPAHMPSSIIDTKKPEASNKSKASVDARVTNEFDSDDIRALLESKSTLSSMPSIDDSITKHAASESLDIEIGKSGSDLNASTDNITITASKSSLTTALDMSTFSVHCKEEEEDSGNSSDEIKLPNMYSS